VSSRSKTVVVLLSEKERSQLRASKIDETETSYFAETVHLAMISRRGEIKIVSQRRRRASDEGDERDQHRPAAWWEVVPDLKNSSTGLKDVDR
jgi:hypothetical protein